VKKAGNAGQFKNRYRQHCVRAALTASNADWIQHSGEEPLETGNLHKATSWPDEDHPPSR
jgi:hypothetical protein